MPEKSALNRFESAQEKARDALYEAHAACRELYRASKEAGVPYAGNGDFDSVPLARVMKEFAGHLDTRIKKRRPSENIY